MFPDIRDSDTRIRRARRYVPLLPRRTSDTGHRVGGRRRAGRFELSDGDRDTFCGPASAPVGHSWMHATTAPALPSSRAERSRNFTAMDLQSRTAFPADLSLPRDNTGIKPKAFLVFAVACALAGTFVLAPREFVTLWMALDHSSLAYERQKAGQLTELPQGVTVENMRFMAEHEAELQAFQAERAALIGRKK